MATTTTTTTAALAATGLVTPHRFTRKDYHRMAEAGILGAHDRVELICGTIIDISPIGNRHRVCVNRLNMWLAPRLQGRAIVQVQGSVPLADDGEPEPDITVMRWRDDFYEDLPPAAADVLLIIEVADSSLRYDREIKARLYAEAQVPEYWLWDLNGRAITLHREPGPEGYGSVATVSGREPLVPLAFPDLTLVPEEFFPKA